MPFKYSLFNYKCNEIIFGSTSEFKRILFTSELEQLVSINVKNKAYFYFLLEKENDISKLTKYEDLNNICTTLLKNETDKKKQEDCIEANLEPIFLNKLLNLGYYPYSTKNNYQDNEDKTTEIDEQHVFISKQNFNEILQHLQTKTKIENLSSKKYTIIDTLLLQINKIQDLDSNFNNIKEELKKFIKSNDDIKLKNKFITIIDDSNTIQELKDALKKYDIQNYIEFTVNGKKYGLFQCHFDWSSDFKYIDKVNILKNKIKTQFLDFKKNKIDFYKKSKDKYSDKELDIIKKYEDLISKLYINEKFYIREGDMTDQRKNSLLLDLIYVDNFCTFGIDVFRDIIPYFNIYTPEQYDLYNLFLNNSEMFQKINKQNLEDIINIKF